MRCELLQLDRMAIDERFGSDAGDAARLNMAIRRRMRLEQKDREEQQIETLADLRRDCGD